MTGQKHDCACPRAQHQHGTYEAYQRDHCRCPPCRQAASRYEKRRAHETAHGRGQLVDAAPARSHVEQLLQAGLTIGQIERRSGVHRTAIRVLLGDMPGRSQATRVRRTTVRALQSVTAALVGDEQGGLVDGVGTARRAQALVAIGYTQAEIARRIGVAPCNSGRIFAGVGLVNAATRRAVMALYDELWSIPAPAGTPNERRARTQALNTARAKGWLPPMAWDDDSIDNPTAVPVAQIENQRDALVENVVWLLDSGAERAEIVARLGVRANTLEITLRRRAPEVWQRVIDTDRMRRDLPRRVA